MVETVDEMVKAHYPFEAQKGLDLNEFSVRVKGLLEAELDDYHFVVELGRTVASLRDGHTRIERFMLGAETGEAPLEYRVEGERVFVAAVKEEGLPIRIGDEIVAIEGMAPLDYLAIRAAVYDVEFSNLHQMQGPTRLLDGPADTVVTVMIAGQGEVELRRRFHLPMPTSERFGDIGYINVSTFGFIDDLDRLDETLNGLMDTKGLIIDLRGNGGGYPSVTDGLFGRLISEPVPGFDMVDVRGKHKRTMYARPRGKTYDRPVVVLTNPRTYSASNYFAHRMSYHRRGVLIGERTGGGAASPEQGVLLVPGVWFQVSTYIVQTPDGVNSEDGLDPDIFVDYSAEALSDTDSSVRRIIPVDPVLTEAIRYLEDLR
jgi:C-terminal processing protease CtpA/Prc